MSFSRKFCNISVKQPNHRDIGPDSSLSLLNIICHYISCENKKTEQNGLFQKNQEKNLEGRA